MSILPCYLTDRDRLASYALSIRQVIGYRLRGSRGAALGDYCSVERGVLRLHGLLPTHDLGRLVQVPVADVEGVDIVCEWTRPDPPAWKDDPWEAGGIGALDEQGRTRWPEGARYCSHYGGHELTLFVRGVVA